MDKLNTEYGVIKEDDCETDDMKTLREEIFNKIEVLGSNYILNGCTLAHVRDVINKTVSRVNALETKLKDE